MGDLDGKAALVTGGASGIGLAATRRLAAEGARVMIVDLDEAAGRSAADEVGGRFVRANVGEAEDWEVVAAACRSAFDGLHVAFLNAGVTTGEGDVTRVTDAQYRRIMAANVDGVVFGTRAVVPLIEDSGGGAIVATASLAGLIAFAADPVYTMTKHAVVGFVRATAPQLAQRGITINAVNPGIVDTPLVGEARQVLVDAGFPLIPPEDIAARVVACAVGTETGQCWVCQPGCDPVPYDFAPVPNLGAAGRLPR